MRVLVVNTRHFHGGGDSTYAFNMGELLRSHGHAVAFFAMNDVRNESDDNADLFVSNIDFRGLNRRKSPGAGLKVLSRSVYSREARRKFGLLLDRFCPDIVHLQNIHGHITPSVIFEAKSRGTPVAWTLHDYKLVCPNSHFLIDATGEICEACGRGSYYQCVLKQCKKGSVLASTMAMVEAYAHRVMRVREHVDAFLAPSRFLKNKLIQHGFLPASIHHLPLFLPEQQFGQGWDKREGYFLFLGKIEAIKGISVLLEACKLAPRVKVVIAGSAEGGMEELLSVSLPGNAQYLGMVERERVGPLIEGCLGVVLPSLWFENQPFAILEAFARSRPVIASWLGGMQELAGDRERGLLVPPGDATELAGAMSWLHSNRGEARDMGERAFDYARREHGSERHYERLMGIYTQVLEK